MAYLWTVSLRGLRWLALVVVLFLMPRSDVERVIVTVGGILWVAMMWQATVYRHSVTQIIRFQLSHLRTLYPTFAALAATHNVENAKDDPEGRYRRLHGMSAKEIDQERWQRRASVDEMGASVETEWVENGQRMDRETGKALIAIVATSIESLTLAVAVLLLMGR